MANPHTQQRNTERALFAAVFAACAYFHQGGGWNQNARFDQVRAIVEAHRLDIGDFWIERPQRLPDGRFAICFGAHEIAAIDLNTPEGPDETL